LLLKRRELHAERVKLIVGRVGLILGRVGLMLGRVGLMLGRVIPWEGIALRVYGLRLTHLWGKHDWLYKLLRHEWVGLHTLHEGVGLCSWLVRLLSLLPTQVLHNRIEFALECVESRIRGATASVLA